jgi:hypothetical protein
MKLVLGISLCLLMLLPVIGHSQQRLIAEVDLTLIKIEGLQLGMTQELVRNLLQQRYNTEGNAQFLRAGVQCDKQQCMATAVGAELQELLQLQFNASGELNWLMLQRRFKGGGSPEECLRQAEQQIDTLRQQYSPVSLLLNKAGHPDPAENNLYGFRAQIKCDPLAKGTAEAEFELRDHSW